MPNAARQLGAFDAMPCTRCNMSNLGALLGAGGSCLVHYEASKGRTPNHFSINTQCSRNNDAPLFGSLRYLKPPGCLARLFNIIAHRNLFCATAQQYDD